MTFERPKRLILGTSHNLSWRGQGGGEIVFYPKLFRDPY